MSITAIVDVYIETVTTNKGRTIKVNDWIQDDLLVIEEFAERFLNNTYLDDYKKYLFETGVDFGIELEPDEKIIDFKGQDSAYHFDAPGIKRLIAYGRSRKSGSPSG